MNRWLENWTATRVQWGGFALEWVVEWESTLQTKDQLETSRTPVRSCRRHRSLRPEVSQNVQLQCEHCCSRSPSPLFRTNRSESTGELQNNLYSAHFQMKTTHRERSDSSRTKSVLETIQQRIEYLQRRHYCSTKTCWKRVHI